MRLILTLLCCALPALAQALDYRSLSDNAIVYDATSRQAKPQFILRKGTPVEQLVALEGWIKVREAGGGIGWVERSLVSERRQLIVTKANSEVRITAADDAAVVFVAARDLVLEMADKPAGSWVKVRHRDGRSGFIDIKSVWGL